MPNIETSHPGRDKYEIVSTVAYLLGVPQRIFENEHEPPQLEIFQKLELCKNARILRNLCLLRTQLERNFGAVNRATQFDYQGLMSLPGLVSTEALTQLSDDGIRLYHPTKRPLQYILDINRHISDRINNCKNLFPLWLDWNYLRDIFIMPEGLTEAGTKAAADIFYGHMACYPYQVYLNWNPSDQGNLLYNDRKFVTLLYQWHEDEFQDYSKVCDVGDFTRSSVYDFIADGQRVAFVVDCENADPYHLCAAIESLPEALSRKISKIILFDDVHAASAWEILRDYTDIPVEYRLIERVKANKSQVDIHLAVVSCQEFYQNQVDSFVLVSSDSDYWGLISNLPEAKFLVMVEHDKCGPDMKQTLSQAGIFYCYLDDFYSGQTSALKTGVLLREMGRYLQEAVHLNVGDMLTQALNKARVTMSPAERTQFFNKYIRPMSMHIDKDYNMVISLGAK